MKKREEEQREKAGRSIRVERSPSGRSLTSHASGLISPTSSTLGECNRARDSQRGWGGVRQTKSVQQAHQRDRRLKASAKWTFGCFPFARLCLVHSIRIAKVA